MAIVWHMQNKKARQVQRKLDDKRKTKQRLSEIDDKHIISMHIEPTDGTAEDTPEEAATHVSLHRAPLSDKQKLSPNDWFLLVKYKAGKYRHCGGYCLTYCPCTGQVVMSTYDSEDGCPSCGEGGVSSTEGITEAVNKDRNILHWKQFERQAQDMIDPCMTIRQLDRMDSHYIPLSILYCTFQYIVSFTQRDLLRLGYSWKARVWTPWRYRAIIKLQAFIRGWLFRHKILYNPNSDIGRRYISAQWKAIAQENTNLTGE